MQTNEEMRQAWEFIEHTSRSVFLTGKAGTGKTTFLHYLKSHSQKRLVVVAPTGVAAINAGGVTIHSFFQLPLSPFVPGTTPKERFDFSREKRKIVRSMDMLVIDEISMVRSDLLDAIDWALRRYRDMSRPFGGVQLLMIGDLQQLTPVVTPADEAVLQGHYASPYFFSSLALRQVAYVTIQLSHVYRQQDDRFIRVLNAVRDNRATAADLAALNARCKPGFEPRDDEGYIRLTTHNHKADALNEQRLAALATRPYTFDAEVDGQFPEANYPTHERLTLKKGAQVMFIKNDTSGEHRYYNGRIGRVVELGANHIAVLCPGDDEAIEVEPMEWQNARYELNDKTNEIEEHVVGVFRQLPLRLAWAITIHKSQGLTFDRAIIDASQAFAPGQAYVALSRCRSLEGLVLERQLPAHAIIGDSRVDQYIAGQDAAARRAIAALPQMREEYYRQLLTELFAFALLQQRQSYVARLLQEFFAHSHPQLTLHHRQLEVALGQKVVAVAQKWLTFIAVQPASMLHSDDFLERVKRSAAYFAEQLSSLFLPLMKPTREAETANKVAMKRYQQAVADLHETYLAHRVTLELIAREGFSVANYLDAHSEAAVRAIDGASPEEAVKRATQRRKKAEKPKKEKKVPTQEQTFELFCQGKSIDEIAQQRGLVPTTIASHLAYYIEMDKLSADKVLPIEKMQTVLHAIQTTGSELLSEIKKACPDDITWGDIRIAMAEVERRRKKA